MMIKNRQTTCPGRFAPGIAPGHGGKFQNPPQRHWCERRARLAGSVLIRTERGCVGDQPQHFERAAADASRTAALRKIPNQDTTAWPFLLTCHGKQAR